LAYHGLRAKEKSFNANIKTDLDPGIGKINVSPQDIGRVMLNLINNAFYAVSQRKLNGSHNGEHLEPTVTLKSRRIGNKVVVSVTDNGNGIPHDVLDKIFQPFFTTKPTGEGTGLGLSLSYDIITKGHDGEIKVDTVEGQGTTFTIVLPV
jgi:two-component system NtrC family sensor kinase